MATKPILPFIRPLEILKIRDDTEKFLEDCDRFFELTQTAEEHRGLFIKDLLSTEAIRKYEENEVEGNKLNVSDTSTNVCMDMNVN